MAMFTNHLEFRPTRVIVCFESEERDPEVHLKRGKRLGKDEIGHINMPRGNKRDEIGHINMPRGNKRDEIGAYQYAKRK